MILNCFDMLMSKMNFKKNYFDIFPSKKHFKKQSLPQFQTLPLGKRLETRANLRFQKI